MARKEIYRYKGLANVESFCNLDIYEQQSGQIIVVLTERKDNPGTSITNVFARIATDVYNKYLNHVPVENIQWIDHYDADSYHQTEPDYDSFAIAKMRWDEPRRRFLQPHWQPCDEHTVETIRSTK